MDKPYSNKKLRESMDEYLGCMISKRTSSDVKIVHEDSCRCAGIQFVDFIAGAVRKYYEADDNTYMQNLKFATRKEMFFF